MTSIRTITYQGPQDWPTMNTWLSARQDPDTNVESTVREILGKVKENGDAALVDYTRRFDSPDFAESSLTIGPRALESALQDLPRPDLDIIEQATANIRRFHEAQKQRSWWRPDEDGTILGQLVRPVDRVGLYVPGGQGGETPLISSLLMNAIPAQVAGVPSICIASPPRKDGSLNPYILATAHLLGITEVHPVGSAWAVAALAYGTKAIAPVDVIAGPGNIFVTTAKRLLIGTIGIDMIAGPSEIAIIADWTDGNTSKPSWLAADMLSQAEHDPQASSLLITPDTNLARAVEQELATQTAALPRSEIAAASLADWGALVVTPDLEQAFDLVNRLAPEHLELALADPWSRIGQVRNAGAVFLGDYCPEPVGDYFAGPNHVLPTMGTARFSSALSVDNFIKKTSIIATSPAFVSRNTAAVARMARLEGLEAHARSMESRLK